MLLIYDSTFISQSIYFEGGARRQRSSQDQSQREDWNTEVSSIEYKKLRKKNDKMTRKDTLSSYPETQPNMRQIDSDT